MRPRPVVDVQKGVEIGLHLVDRLVPGGPALHAEVLVEQGPVEALDEAIRLRSSHFGGTVLDLFELQEELLGMLVGPTAELAAVVQYTAMAEVVREDGAGYEDFVVLLRVNSHEHAEEETWPPMTRHLGPQDVAVGIDLAAAKHVVVVLDAKGKRPARFSIPHSLQGLKELLRRTQPRKAGTAVYAFEATGHVWEVVGHFLAGRGVEYRIVNPLATHRLREARELNRDKRDETDAEQIAEMLLTGLVTQFMYVVMVANFIRQN